MAFVPRNFEQILTDMIAHVRANTTLTDFNVGSVIRTILEAAALEDDEQYYQMVQLLDAFRIATASGEDLDERAADFNVVRLLPASAFTSSIVFTNENLIKANLLYDVVSGGGITLTVEDSSDFPVAPFAVRVGEGTPQVEDTTVSLHDTVSNTFIVTLVNNHSAGDRVAVTGVGDKTISSGQQIQVPATGYASPIGFSTISTAIIIDGNYESNRVDGKANEAGRTGNVPAGTIVEFQGSPPFVGAGVVNKDAPQGGRDLESDTDLRTRLLAKLDELSRGTPYAIESGVIGIEDPLTGQSVSTSRLREDFDNPRNHRLFIDDGSGFIPTSVNMAKTTLRTATLSGITALPVTDVDAFPDGGLLLIDPAGVSGNTPEVIEYSSKDDGGGSPVLNLDSPTASVHDLGVEVLVVDDLGIAEDSQNFFRLNDFPVKDNTIELYDNESGIYAIRTKDTDYVINKTNGEIQYLGAGLSSGTRVLGNYGYFTGLVQEVQKVVTGDAEDRVNYPGLAAGGILIHVDTPTIRRITVTMSVTVQDGFDKDEVKELVRADLESYINKLRIGDNVYTSRLIETGMRTNGVLNVVLTTPTTDIVILEDELSVPADSNGNTLVTVL